MIQCKTVFLTLSSNSFHSPFTFFPFHPGILFVPLSHLPLLFSCCDLPGDSRWIRELGRHRASTPSRPVNMHANVALDISTTARACRGRGMFGWVLWLGWVRRGREEEPIERENRNKDGQYYAPVCNSLSTSGNINSWTISHLGTEFRGLSQGSEHNGVQGNRHWVY